MEQYVKSLALVILSHVIAKLDTQEPTVRHTMHASATNV